MTRRNLQPLESLLTELSQRIFKTRWYNGMSWWAYHWMQSGASGGGGHQNITAHDIQELRDAALDLEGGWMLYPMASYAAYIDKHRWTMAYGGGPDKVIEETRRLERKLQLALDAEDHLWVDGLLQGTRRWW